MHLDHFYPEQVGKNYFHSHSPLCYRRDLEGVRPSLHDKVRKCRLIDGQWQALLKEGLHQGVEELQY